MKEYSSKDIDKAIEITHEKLGFGKINTSNMSAKNFAKVVNKIQPYIEHVTHLDYAYRVWKIKETGELILP